MLSPRSKSQWYDPSILDLSEKSGAVELIVPVVDDVDVEGGVVGAVGGTIEAVL